MPARIGPRRAFRVYLAAWRESRGLTQAQLANRLGTNDMTVSRWERGIVQIKTDTQAAIAEALDIEPGDLWHHPDQPSPSELLRQQSEALDSALASLENLRRNRG